MRAIWKGEIIAESNDTVEVEGNHYFPAASVNMEFIRPGNAHTSCPWKGEASYYSIEVGGEANVDAAWYYPEPKEAAKNIKGRVAFWRGVEVKE
ncbi:MAG: DUF427 domain-containing protein [Gammaproteobacteria bacterium]|jgi:uncharacterized protein (DUF427 family)|nr:DUF427 domain-containing protein [Gammaproteobacteria bacterium]